MGDRNREEIEDWNTSCTTSSSSSGGSLTASLGIHGTRVMDRHPPAKGTSVVDLGCGFGETTIELARRVGPAVRTVGVDAAERFITRARDEARGVSNALFEVADVESRVPGGPYDLASL